MSEILRNPGSPWTTRIDTRPSVFFVIVPTLLFFSFLAFLLSACNQRPGDSEAVGNPPTISSATWLYSHLRAVDAPDAPEPGMDILAAYYRRSPVKENTFGAFGFPSNGSQAEIQLRLDFLDLTTRNECDLYLLLDHKPGGGSFIPWEGPNNDGWDTLFIIPARGEIQAKDANGVLLYETSLRVLRDPALDNLIISLDGANLAAAEERLRMQVLTTPPGVQATADSLSPFRATDSPPQPVKILFAFWDVFPAGTPAQALRSWDGAHTGPLGGRHGLHNLLRPARSEGVPITLLDLNNPKSLSALDYAGGTRIVTGMAAERLLLLPYNFPAHLQPDDDTASDPSLAEFKTRYLETSRMLSQDFDLPASQFVYSQQIDQIHSQFLYIFKHRPDGAQGAEAGGLSYKLRWKDKSIITIPEELPLEQASFQGISLAVRRNLAQAATSQPSAWVILGGSLPQSEWGVPQIARAGFRYIQSHPWMHVIGADEIIAAGGSGGISDSPPLDETPPLSPATVRQLASLVESPLAHIGWQSIFQQPAVKSPGSIEGEQYRAQLSGQINVLSAVAQWNAQPIQQATCNHDLDLDGAQECVLASSSVFALFDSDEGALAYLFVRSGDELHQIIAPVMDGSGDLSGAETTARPGAFADGQGPYQDQIRDQQLLFTGDQVIKGFRLMQTGLSVEYQVEEALATTLFLTLDPWIRFSSGWGDNYRGSPASLGWVWNLAGETEVAVKSNAISTLAAFNETRRFMFDLEDPNQEYPPGHYLPFPQAKIDFLSDGDFTVTIELTQP